MADQGTVLVTGGASGIGFAIVEAAARQGWRVIVADASEDRLAEARERLAPHRASVWLKQMDVTDEAAVVAAIAQGESEAGPLCGAVNSAGTGSDIPCLETTTADFRRLLEINLIGSFVVAREAARRMSARGRGSIVNIASVSGLRGNSGRVAYGASKAGVVAMSQVMAVELASAGVRVNAIAPGVIETPLVQEMHSPERRAQWMKLVPQGRYGMPEEVASAALFLLDDTQSSYVTGQTITVDGGFMAGGVIGTAPTRK
jgi:NAD(P)-dependent dehydrogenase (short-subunit alcohol dehydrogenase family)